MEQPYRRNSYSKCLQGREWLKYWSYDTYVRKGWPQTNVVEYFLCIGTAKYTKASPPAWKISLFSSIIVTIILSYTIIRIYIILHICLQVSETEGIVELDRVIGQSVLALFRMGIFGAAQGWGGQKGPPSLKSITHILQWWNLAQLYLT